MPGSPKSKVKSRIILTPQHAKRLAKALADNISRFEANNGEIKDYEQPPIPLNFSSAMTTKESLKKVMASFWVIRPRSISVTSPEKKSSFFQFLNIHNQLILPYRAWLGIRLRGRYNAY